MRRRPLIILLVGLLGFILIALGVTFWMSAPKPSSSSSSSKDPVATTMVLSPFAKGLEQPVGIVSPGGADTRLFVVEQAGKIKTVTARGKVESTPLLDISSRVKYQGEMGLLGLVFDPQFSSNGYLYVNYVDKSQVTHIARFQLNKGSTVIDPSTEVTLLTAMQPHPNHKGGDLQFGPDGYLYIALGDGGGTGDPDGRAQNKTTLLGKLLRIDVHKGYPYGIPKDNPFVGSEARPEIWAYGLRNPWRISFDKKTNDLYIADVGQGKMEEVNRQSVASKGGENYGWRCYEGALSYNLTGCEGKKLVEPIITYARKDPLCAVTGGYVYRGSRLPFLSGSYLYADFCSGEVFAAKENAGKWQSRLLRDTSARISTFGQDGKGELYMADIATGILYQLQAK